MESHTKGVATKVTLPDGREFVVIEIEIDCPACGHYALQVAGHHLRAVRDIVIEMIDLHPDLTGRDDDLQVLERLRFDSRPGDPTQN